VIDFDKYGASTTLNEILLANIKDLIGNSIFESISEGIMLFDLEGFIITCNDKVLNQLEYKSLDKIIGINASYLFSEYGKEKFRLFNIDDLEKSSIIKKKYNCLRKNGDPFPAEVTTSLLKDKNGNPFGYLCVISELSWKNSEEQYLPINELNEKSILENSTIGIYRADREGNLLAANSRILDILGIDSFTNLQNKNIDSELIVDKSIRKKFHNILLDEGKIYGFESQWKKSDGKIVYLRESATAFWDNEKNLDYYVGTVEDITEYVSSKMMIKKQADIIEALGYCSELFLSDISWKKNLVNAISIIGESIDVSAVQVFENEFDSDKNIIFKQISVWKNSKQEIESIPFEINLNKNNLQSWWNKLSQNNLVVKHIKDANQDENTFLAAFGIKSTIIFPIMLDGDCLGEIAFHQYDYDRIWDSSEYETLRAASEILSAAIKRSNYEKELIDAKKAAEAADRTKSEFLAQMSHEIRTPLNNITSFNTLIKEQLENQIDDDIKGCFDVIDRASNRLIRTIGLILNLSELHTDSYKLSKSNFDIYADLLERIYLENRFRAKQQNIDFKLVNKATSTLIYADKYSLDQILNNLVDNAFKYTEEGKIEIEICNNEKRQIIVKISDSGIGISEDFLPNIFSPFSQEEAGYTRKFDGNGIGLTLVKEYCDLNEIQIDVSSKKNFGTIFTLILNANNYQ
jgi:PAS domain S-box-containing protein